MIRFYRSVFPTGVFFYAIAGIIVLFVLGHFFPVIFSLGKVVLVFFIALILTDLLLLYRFSEKTVFARRILPEKFSNGDKNRVQLKIIQKYPFSVRGEIIDELPPQLQIRNFLREIYLKPGEPKIIEYYISPSERGEYEFGNINIFVSGKLLLFKRRYKKNAKTVVPVYPSFLQMRKYELIAASNFLTEAGIKKIRQVSHSFEFDQIREYVKGDAYRSINWKATARKAKIMVNQYQAERSQAVYSLLDMGRTMKFPFEGMTLLDHAINASLVISNIAMNKEDKAGLISFSKNIHSVVQAERSSKHLRLIMEHLYNQETNFMEPNFELLYATVKRQIKQRSLILLYTNFEGISSLRRQLHFLKALAKLHLVVVIFFENVGLKELIDSPADNLMQVYEKTVAEQFAYEKRLMVKELNRHSIHAFLTSPEHLTTDTINKYLELKAKGLI